MSGGPFSRLGMNWLLAMTAFVLLSAVTRALRVTANLALIRLHGSFLVAESAGTGCWMVVVPVGPGGHRSLLTPDRNKLRFINSILQPQLFWYKQTAFLRTHAECRDSRISGQ